MAVSNLPDEEGEFDIPEWEDDGQIVDNLYPLEAPEEVDIEDCGSDLSLEHKKQLHRVMRYFVGIFRNIPGRTSVIEHQMQIGDAAPVRQKAYRVPYSRREIVKHEIDEMLKANVIRPSLSPWAAPIVLVPKKDGGIRF